MTEIQLTKTELAEWRDIVRSNMSNGVHVETSARIADAYIVACRERDAARTTEPPGIAEVFFRHWDIGWAVFNPNGEGVESLEPTYEAAVLHVSGTYVDGDERGEVEIYPVAYARNGGEEDRLVKLSDADAEVLTSVREILDRLGRLPERAGRWSRAMTADEFDDYETDQDEPWCDDEDDGPGFDEKTAIELGERYPGRFVSLCKVWTPERNTIDSVASHEPLVGELLAVLVSVSEPHTEEQREAMQRLRDLFYREREPAQAESEGP